MANQIAAKESAEFKRLMRRLWIFLITRIVVMAVPCALTVGLACQGNVTWAIVFSVLSLVVINKTLAACLTVGTYLFNIDLYHRGDYATLSRAYFGLLKALRRTGNQRTPAYAQALGHYGSTIAELGDGPAAVEACQNAITQLERSKSKTLAIYQSSYQPHLASANMQLSKALFVNGDYEESLKCATIAMEIFKSPGVREKHYRWAAWVLTLAAADKLLLHQSDTAGADIEEALRLFESDLAPGPMGPRAGQQSKICCYACLALLNYEQGAVVTAVNHVERIFGEWQRDPVCLNFMARTMLKELRQRDTIDQRMPMDKLAELVGGDT